jgi:hypothetical protein
MGGAITGGLPMYALSAIDALLIGLILTIVAFTAVWIYRDAFALGMFPWVWFLIALFTWPFGVYAYLLLRNSSSAARTAVPDGNDIA